MANEEIVTALKNAIERDEDLDEASQTLMNAGYSSQEVHEALAFLKDGVLSAESKAAERAEEKAEQEKKPSFFEKIVSSLSKHKTKDETKGNEEKENIEIRETQPKPLSPIQSAPITPRPASPQSEKSTFLVVAIIILILLIIILSLSIMFKDAILNLFS